MNLWNLLKEPKIMFNNWFWNKTVLGGFVPDDIMRLKTVNYFYKNAPS